MDLDTTVVSLLHKRIADLETENAGHSKRWAALASECHDLRIELAELRKLVIDNASYTARYIEASA